MQLLNHAFTHPQSVCSERKNNRWPQMEGEHLRSIYSGKMTYFAVFAEVNQQKRKLSQGKGGE